jgi:hypothetical protein
MTVLDQRQKIQLKKNWNKNKNQPEMLAYKMKISFEQSKILMYRL